MKTWKYIQITIVITLFFSCSNTDDNNNSSVEAMYFPPNNSPTWETKTINQLGWNESEVQPLLDYLELKNSKSFMILHNGKIVMEYYFNGHTANSSWYWASAGKTLTTAITGIAQEEGYININNKVSDYIGTNWTSAPLAKENLITCKHLLTMTTGLDDTNDQIEAANLNYLADAGTRWAYHSVFFKLQDVVEQATSQNWDNYFNAKLKTPIGMSGLWLPTGSENVYWSNTRSMARFGLLALNYGKWKSSQIVNHDFFTTSTSTSTSQNINLSYGYLWWLNGKASYHLPNTQFEFNGSIIPSGPNDMFMALGKNDQKIYVVPSKKIVIIRMGNAADNETAALSDFDEVLWQKINAVINP